MHLVVYFTKSTNLCIIIFRSDDDSVSGKVQVADLSDAQRSDNSVPRKVSLTSCGY